MGLSILVQGSEIGGLSWNNDLSKSSLNPASCRDCPACMNRTPPGVVGTVAIHHAPVCSDVSMLRPSQEMFPMRGGS